MIKIANKLFRNGKFQDALFLYQDCIKKNPSLTRFLRFNIESCKKNLFGSYDYRQTKVRNLRDSLEFDITYLATHYKYYNDFDTIRECHANDFYIDNVLNHVEGLVEKFKIKYLSFDVFDTVLLRNKECESIRFWNISNRFAMLHGLDPYDIFHARIDAAKIAYSVTPIKNQNREGDFDLIAKLACEALRRPDLVESYVTNELESESEMLCASKLFKEISKRFSGCSVLFISDMYLESKRISKILTDKGVGSSPIVFSSADGYGSKRGSGTLFKYVEDTLKCMPTEIIHFGDNYASDFQNPKRFGWNAVFLPMPINEKNHRIESFNKFINSMSSSSFDYSKILSFNI